MPTCIICDKHFEAQRADAQICSGKCRQQAHRQGIKLRGQRKGKTAPISGIERYLSPEPPAASQGAPKGRIWQKNNNILPGGLGQVRIGNGGDTREIEKAFIGIDGSITLTVGPKSAPETFLGHPIPQGLKGIDLTIWKAEMKEKH